MTGFRTHEDFDAWRLADELRTRMRPVLARPALRDDFDLWKQLRRATRSPCPNIAEGFSRFNPPDFANFVRIAKASLSEFIEHMKEAEACGYTTPAETAELIVLARRARGAATGLIQYLDHARPPGHKAQPRNARPRSRRRRA
jgi:four helix bundle protein